MFSSRNNNTQSRFIIKKSKLVNRWDPYYHQPFFEAIEQKIKANPWTTLRQQSNKIISGITPESGGSAYCEKEQGVPFIRSGDFNEDGSINWNDIIYIKDEIHNGIMRRSRLCKGDILFAIVGATIGKVGIYQYDREANINQAVCAVRLSNALRSEYVHAFFLTPTGKELIDRIKRPVARANINLAEISSLIVPKISDAKQRVVAEALTNAFRKKKEIEQEASSLLESIDTILLRELGIKLPPEPPNTIKSRIFQRRISQITGNRFDPASHWKKLILNSSRYPMKNLPDLVRINPITDFKGLKPEDKVTFVPMESVGELFGEITEKQTRSVIEAKSYTTFKEGDLIWAKITPCMENGKAAIASNLENGYGYGSTEFHVFRLKNGDMNINFLHAILRLKVLRSHARLFFTGSSGHQRVDERFFKRLEIPAPPRKIQDKIALEIEDIRTEARGLFSSAEQELIKSKKKIEKLIFDDRGVK